nr:MAG TPA: hypothetical protein [Caudoviricetes sp.]
MYKTNVHRINFCEYNLIAGNPLELLIPKCNNSKDWAISSEILFFLNKIRSTTIPWLPH